MLNSKNKGDLNPVTPLDYRRFRAVKGSTFLVGFTLRRVGSLFVSVALLISIFAVATTKEAHAQYVEPGTISLLVQMLIAGGLASLVAVKVFWQRITGRIS